ncbi:MAG: flagellar filament outer layer protein FlaA [Treponema sp.]|nr:flagellar filament outer layer protein FlaA [Treponema sp.]
MKKLLILVVIAMLSVPLFAEEGVLIDFSLLAADITVKLGENDPNDTPNQHQQTVMDFAHVAGGSFTPDQKGFMKTSLAIENWEVILASSSRSVDNVTLSRTRQAKTRGYLRDGARVEEEAIVMGVRVRFPVEPFNSWALIKPPFDIPAYEMSTVGSDGTVQPMEEADVVNSKSRFEAQQYDDNGRATSPAFGVIKNVGVIREIKVQVYGLNFPHGLSTIIIDSMGNERTIFMGYLNFDGWRELTWRNPAYLAESRNREMRIVPLYPFNTPFIKFGGFLIQRDAARMGGDFVTYFKEVAVIYDKAVLDANRDINDEAVWNIIQTREEARKVWEMERFGQNQVLRYLEQQRMATELPFGNTGRQQ